MEIKYTKMHGLGNDFIIIDNRNYKFTESQLQKIAKIICQRKLSIGADGLMAVEAASKNADFRMRFFNSDGTIGEMCGNGARCMARYAFVNKIAGQKMEFETTAGNIYGEIKEKRLVAVALNTPEIIEEDKRAMVDGKEYIISYVELGNPGVPHGVIEYKGLKGVSKEGIFDLARKLRYHDVFYKGANINFYDISEKNTAVVRTYERGVEDFTLACGTGAASVAVVMYIKKLVDSDKIKISVPGGDLFIEIEADKKDDIQKLMLIGDTNIVSEGTVLDEDLDIESILKK